jgi:hypothetical protein
MRVVHRRDPRKITLHSPARGERADAGCASAQHMRHGNDSLEMGHNDKAEF